MPMRGASRATSLESVTTAMKSVSADLSYRGAGSALAAVSVAAGSAAATARKPERRKAWIFIGRTSWSVYSILPDQTVGYGLLRKCPLELQREIFDLARGRFLRFF